MHWTYGARKTGYPDLRLTRIVLVCAFVFMSMLSPQTLDAAGLRGHGGPEKYTPGSKMPLQRIQSRKESKALLDFLELAGKAVAGQQAN